MRAQQSNGMHDACPIRCPVAFIPCGKRKFRCAWQCFSDHRFGFTFVRIHEEAHTFSRVISWRLKNYVSVMFGLILRVSRDNAGIDPPYHLESSGNGRRTLHERRNSAGTHTASRSLSIKSRTLSGERTPSSSGHGRLSICIYLQASPVVKKAQKKS
jgi:hypothetical protein